MARTKVADKIVLRDENGIACAIRILFTDGREVKVNLETLGQIIKAEALAHGISQKLGDSYSGCQGNLDEAFAECAAVAESIIEGNWNRKGGSGGGELAQAIADLTGKELDEIIPVLRTMSDEDKATLRRRKDVKAALAKIKAAKAEAAAKAGGSSGDLNELF